MLPSPTIPTLINAAIRWLNSSSIGKNKPLPETNSSVSKKLKRMTKRAPRPKDQLVQSSGKARNQEAEGTSSDDLTEALKLVKVNTLASYLPLLPNGSHSYMRIPDKLGARPYSFPSSVAARSVVNLHAFPIFCNRVKILSPSTKVRSAEGREVLLNGEMSLKVCIWKGTWTVKFTTCLEPAWDVILCANFLHHTKDVLNFAEGNFSTHCANKANAEIWLSTDDICNALFEAAAIPMNSPDDLCAQMIHISDDGRKELRELLLKCANIFSWQGAKLGRTYIVEHTIATGEARSIWQPPRRIPPPLLEEVNRPVKEMIRDEVIKPSK
uniref:Gap Pol polyprotein n=1 Tax=Echinococcus granulosus TaxID=6210 RepID=A0A068W7I3_ECHGR|nr:Gap Pol polyprotein [Echinococcus granulosus]